MSSVLFAVVLFAAFTHALWNFCAKKVSGDLSVFWLGSLGAAIACAPIALYQAWYLPWVSELLVFMAVTGVIHSLNFYFLARAYEAGDFSLVYPLARGMGVAGTALASAVVLQDPLSRQGLFGIGAVCLGALLLGLKTGKVSAHPRSSFLNCFCIGLTMIGYTVIDSSAVRSIPPLLYVCGVYFIFSLLLAPYVWKKKRGAVERAWRSRKIPAVIIGFGSLGTYLIILYAFRSGPLGYIVAVRECSVAIGAALGVIFLKEAFTMRRVMGVLAIVTGLILIKMA